MSALLSWIASLPVDTRDAALEGRFGIDDAPSAAPPGEHLIGYHPSGVAPIVRALFEIPVRADDVIVDLGAGLGKVVLLAHLLTGATARGIEIQPALVVRARDAARALGADVRFDHGDARNADMRDGTVFFLYVPFTGPALAEVLDRLRPIASRRAIVVCALGVDLDRAAPWLVPRPTDAFWLTIYDSVMDGVSPRTITSSPLDTDAMRVAFER